MTKRVKNISILILTLLLSIAVIMTVNLISKAKTVDALFLATTENVNVETEKVVSWLNTLNPIYCEAVPLTLEEIFISETEVAGYDIKSLIS